MAQQNSFEKPFFCRSHLSSVHVYWLNAGATGPLPSCCPRCAGSAIHLRVLGFQTATHWCRESYSNSYERGGKNLLYKLGLNLTKEDSKPIFQQRHFTFNLHKSFMALPAILGQLRDKLRDRVVRQVRTGCCCTVLN